MQVVIWAGILLGQTTITLLWLQWFRHELKRESSKGVEAVLVLGVVEIIGTAALLVEYVL